MRARFEQHWIAEGFAEFTENGRVACAMAAIASLLGGIAIVLGLSSWFVLPAATLVALIVVDMLDP
jgi:hypothetical protein